MIKQLFKDNGKKRKKKALNVKMFLLQVTIQYYSLKFRWFLELAGGHGRKQGYYTKVIEAWLLTFHVSTILKPKTTL